MRSWFFFSISILFSNVVRAQDSTYYEPFEQSLDLIYGQKYFQNSVLDGKLNNFENAAFGTPLSYIGIGITSFVNICSTSRYNVCYQHPGGLYFYHVIPQKIVLSDSVSGRISGFNVGMTFFGWDAFAKKRWLDLLFTGGLKTGRIRLYGHSSLEQVNAYLAPFISINPRFVLGKLSVQFRAEYELDITRSKWRKVWFSTSPKIDLGPMRSSGLSTSVSVGWAF